MTLVKLDGAQEQIRGIVSRDLNPLAMGNCNWVPYDFPDINMHRGRRRSAPVIMGASATVTPAQRVTALRHLLQNNIHGIATAMYKQYQANPNAFTTSLANHGMNPATIIADMQMGNGKAAAAAISGRRVGAASWPLMPTTLGNYTFNSQFVGPGTSVTDSKYGLALSDLNTLLNYAASYNYGQDMNGYYGTQAGTDIPGSNPGNFNASADAEMRGWYAAFASDGMKPLYAPLAKGAAINTTYATAQANNSKTVVQDVTAAAAPLINAEIPGAGTLLNSLVGNAPGTTSPSNPGNLPPPPPPAVVPGFFTPTVMVVGAAALAVGIGLLIAFND